MRGLGYHVPRLVHDFPYDFSKNSDLHIREHLLDIVRVGGAGLVDEERPGGPVHGRLCSYTIQRIQRRRLPRPVWKLSRNFVGTFQCHLTFEVSGVLHGSLPLSKQVSHKTLRTVVISACKPLEVFEAENR